MSEFEYASVVVSIVLALGIAEILRFLADTLRDPGTGRVYWVHFLWIVLLLELHMEFWWLMWGFRDQITVGPELAAVLVGPASLFIATRIILPHDGELDMHRLYYKNKNAFFITLIVTILWSAMTGSWSLLGDQRSLLYLSLLLTVVIIAAFAACLFTENKRFHGAVVVGLAVLEIAEAVGWLLEA